MASNRVSYRSLDVCTALAHLSLSFFHALRTSTATQHLNSEVEAGKNKQWTYNVLFSHMHRDFCVPQLLCLCDPGCTLAPLQRFSNPSFFDRLCRSLFALSFYLTGSVVDIRNVDVDEFKSNFCCDRQTRTAITPQVQLGATWMARPRILTHPTPSLRCCQSLN